MLAGCWHANSVRMFWRSRVKGAAPCQSRGTLAAFHATPPLWGGGVKYSRSLYFANAYHI